MIAKCTGVVPSGIGLQLPDAGVSLLQFQGWNCANVFAETAADVVGWCHMSHLTYQILSGLAIWKPQWTVASQNKKNQGNLCRYMLGSVEAAPEKG